MGLKVKKKLVSSMGHAVKRKGDAQAFHIFIPTPKEAHHVDE